MRVTIIINESDQEILNRLRAQIERCREAGHEVRPHLTFEGGDAVRMGREACEHGCDLLIVAGGDGTINEAVNGLAEWMRDGEGRESPRLAIIPRGTANDLAGALAIPGDVDEGMEVALGPAEVSMDIGVVEGRCFVNVSTGGFGAEATEEASAEAKKVLGPLAYLVTGVRKFATLQPLTARVTAEGRTLAEGRFLLFAAGNNPRTGGGNFLTPRADPSDGLLDLCLVSEMSRVEFLPLLPQLRSGDHLDHPAVIYRQLREFTLESEDELSVNADGEPMSGKRFRYSLAPWRLKVKVPAKNLGVGI